MSDNLIENLAKDLEPVRGGSQRLPPSLRWFAVTILCVGTGVSLLGLRSDIISAIYSISFWLQLSLIVLLSISAISAAFILSIPGHDKTKIVPWLVGAPLSMWFLQFLVGISWDNLSTPWQGYFCSTEILALGILPGAFLIFLIRKSAPTNLGLTGTFGMIGTAAAAAVGTHFTCSLQEPMHLMLFHFAPILVIGAVGILIGKRLLRW
jgi:hypothetical protein